MKKVFPFIFILIACASAKGQELTNKGKNFWLCFPSHVPNQREGVPFLAKMSLFITSDKNSSGTITVPGVFNTTFSILPGQVAEIDIPYSIAHINAAEAGTVVSKGIHVLVDSGKSAVVVYAHIYAGFRSAASLVLPVPVLGKKYFSMNALQRGIDGSKSQFVVVAVSANTAVRITPVKDGVPSIPFTINLPRAGDVYELQSDKDLSGSLIESIPTATDICKKIAVFSGSSAINIATNGNCLTNDSYDPLYQQLYPVNAWGKKYGLIPFENYSYGNPYRILAAEDNTAVKLNGVTVAVLNAGEYYPNNSSFGILQVPATFITADKPVSVAQYAQSSACSGATPTPGKGYGDPDMVMLNPVEQNVNNITVFSSQKENIYSDAKFINILIPQNAAGSFKVNNVVPVATWQPVLPAASGFAYAKINLPAGLNAFSLSADSAFNATAYGFGDYESYAYSAGTNVKDLYRAVTIQNEFGTATFPASCKKNKFKILVTFPYKTNRLTWKFNGVFPDEIVNNPVPADSFFINGKKVYQYKLDTEHTIAASGDYTFSIIANNPVFDNCQGDDEVEYNLQVIDQPHAGYNFTNTGCVTDAVVFTDNSDSSGRNVSKWFWDFGDNNFSAAQSTRHQYVTGNNYNAQHWFINDIGCISDTAKRLVSLTNLPVAKFNAAVQVCQYSSITFTDNTVLTGAGVISKWFWNFGDNTQQVNNTNSPVAHVYTKDTSLVVSLQVESSSGCKSAVYQQPLQVYPKPVADFIIPAFCMPQSGQFISKAVINNGTVNQLAHAWNFGDGTAPVTNQDPYHQYNSTGPFSVKLKVVSAGGCTADTVKVVNTIYPLAHISVSAPLENCFGDSTVVMVNTLTIEGKQLSDMYYKLNNDIIYSSVPIAAGGGVIRLPLLYSSTGIQTVKIFGKLAASGCSTDTINKTIYINKLPSAAFTVPYPLCNNKVIQFRDISVANDGNIIKWKWDFSNGNITSVQHAQQLFDTGTFVIKLQVETDKGCKTAALPAPIKINSVPVPNFEMPGICLSDGVANFVNKSSIADGSTANLVYLWHFGDPSSNALNPDSSIQKDVAHRYTAIGFYPVRLKAVSKDGCAADTVRIFTVNGTLPVAGFKTIDSIKLCSNKNITIENDSRVDFGNIIKMEIFWDSDNDPQNKEVDLNPYIGKKYTHLYPVTNSTDKLYTIRYVAFSGNSCINEIKRTVLIRAVPKVVFDPLNNVCENAEPFIIRNGYEISGIRGTGGYYGKGININGLFNPKLVKPGIDTLLYTFTTAIGCAGSKMQTIKVLPLPSVNAGSDKFISANETVVLNGSGNGINFSWSPLISITNANTASPVVSPANSITYTLTVTSSDGCKATDEAEVKVFSKLNIPNAFTPNNDGLNDTWKIPLIENYGNDISVQIFNRYGQTVFYSKGYTSPWDGRFKGEPLSSGTYTYLINLGKGKQPASGFVILIR
jgi:gliding motility-associated-like protein